VRFAIQSAVAATADPLLHFIIAAVDFQKDTGTYPNSGKYQLLTLHVIPALYFRFPVSCGRS
jgi:hypothetical protein